MVLLQNLWIKLALCQPPFWRKFHPRYKITKRIKDRISQIFCIKILKPQRQIKHQLRLLIITLLPTLRKNPCHLQNSRLKMHQLMFSINKCPLRNLRLHKIFLQLRKLSIMHQQTRKVNLLKLMCKRLLTPYSKKKLQLKLFIMLQPMLIISSFRVLQCRPT